MLCDVIVWTESAAAIACDWCAPECFLTAKLWQDTGVAQMKEVLDLNAIMITYGMSTLHALHPYNSS